LLQLNGIAPRQERAVLQIQLDVDIAADQLAVQQTDGRFDKVIDIDVLRLPLAFPQKTAETVDDLTCPIVFVNNLLESIANFDEVRRILRQEMEGCLRIGQDRGERLVDFVRNRSGKLSEHGHAHQVFNFQTLQRDLGLGRLLFGDVDKYAAELIRSAISL
jgi:hypothetical protein